MRIDSIGVAVPSRQITNQAILDLIQTLNSDLPDEVVQTEKTRVARLLRRAGSESRFARDRDKGERSIDLVKSAVTKAFEVGGFRGAEIDLLVSCSVAKGFREPASAYIFAEALGLSCECFDVMDACMGWARSLQIVESLFETGRYERALIISAEFNLYENGFPDEYRIVGKGDAEERFPSYTVGEASAATVVSADGESWNFTFKSLPELAHVCAIPTEGFQDYLLNGSPTTSKRLNRLFADSGQMLDAARSHFVPLIRECVADLHRPDIWIPHTASCRFAEDIGAMLGIGTQKIFVETFRRYGNLVSASIPVAIEAAIESDVLRRGHEVVLCPASAGMVFGVVQFRY